ncbi:MAG: antibiotic biosynthesis monooxygenase [Candidatus Acidiferrum sp.]
MELFIFGRFHVRLGKEGAFSEALREVVQASGLEPGCLEIHGYRSKRDERLFYIHSRWEDERAFEVHAKMAHTVKFIEHAEAMVDHELDITRAERLV